jgi:CheY-like chemotaxis protein
MPTILIADESPFFLNVYKNFLRQSVAVILEARNAEGVKELLAQKKPDLVYMAYNVPDQTGADCCKFIKDNRELASIPVILICDDETSPQVKECRAAGCNGVLIKPLVRTSFVDVGKILITGIREIRRSCRVSAHCINHETDFTARGLDISRGGIFLESGESIELNEKLHLRIQLCRPGEDGEWLECVGEVAWLNRKEKMLKPSHPVGFGVRFLKISFTETERLHSYLKKLDGNK